VCGTSIDREFEGRPSLTVLPRQARLERARELQRLRRARLRNHSTNGSVSKVSSSFLPLHQREAVDAFFDRVVSVRADIGECQICLERYHGMHLRGLECDMCHREVSFHPVFLVLFILFSVF
jgi:hypothetical protein